METFITPIAPIKPMEWMENVQEGSGKASGFQNVLSQAIEELEAAGETSKENDIRLAMGDVDNIAQIQIDSLKARTMLQTTVQLTSRMVNAYKEVMQMQV